MTQNLTESHSTSRPDRGQFFVEHLDGFGVLVAFMQLGNGKQDPVVIPVDGFKRGVLDLVLIRRDRLTIKLHLLLQTRGKILEVRCILVGEALSLLQPQHPHHPQITVGPGAADHRAVIQPGQSILTNAGFAAFDLQKPRIRDDHHQQHDGDNYRKARQNALA
ncbi:hypothetical protein D3C81_973180 [compost metagenome]